MSLLRAFAAVSLPSATQKEIALHSAALQSACGRSLRWVNPANLHLTLQFFGDVPAESLQTLAKRLQTGLSALPAFSLRLQMPGIFPHLRQPKVLWLGMEAPTALKNIHRLIQEAALKQGLAPEERPYHPHLTLARIPAPLENPAQTALREFLTAFPAASLDPIPVNEIHLFRSDLQPGGPRYTRLHTISLATP
jgi:2'-5' RNA ligase